MSGAGTNDTWRVGIDIGGTFTDVVAVEPARGTFREAKVRTVAGSPADSIEAALGALDLDWSRVADLMHGTTLVTNAIVEGRLAPVALIASAGFRDVLAIGRQNRRYLYRLDLPPKPPPLVPEALRLEVAERIDAEGAVITPLDAAAIDGIAEAVADLGVEAVAVALLNAYANPTHETRLGDRLGAELAHVALSHALSPEAREYERTATTVLNAALMPLVADYLAELVARAADGTRVHLFHSAGGMASPEAVRTRPLALALSGPAAGVAAAAEVARTLDLDRVISFDMGGTTTDVCLITEGAAEIAGDRSLAGHPLRQPMVAVESIGAGGGSLARAEGAAIRVGPDSAGAEPGPACYGLGGDEPTVTDANLLLGYLDPARTLGGSLRLDPARAEAAIGRLARSLGVAAEVVPAGIVRVANASMARALRRVTVERGVDARDCVLLAFGGAGPMHAVALAREFGITRVVVPRSSSVFSALGCLTAELSYAQQRTARLSSRRWDGARLAAIVADMRDQLAAPLAAAGHDPAAPRLDAVAAIRYAGQSYAVEVPFTPPADPDRLDADFKVRHQRLYGYVTDEPWELDWLRLRLSAPPRFDLAAVPALAATAAVAPMSVAPCRFGDGPPLPTPRFARDRLGCGQRIPGPAVIEDAWSTIVVDPGATAWADARGHLHIEIGEGE